MGISWCVLFILSSLKRAVSSAQAALSHCGNPDCALTQTSISRAGQVMQFWSFVHRSVLQSGLFHRVLCPSHIASVTVIVQIILQVAQILYRATVRARTASACIE